MTSTNELLHLRALMSSLLLKGQRGCTRMFSRMWMYPRSGFSIEIHEDLVNLDVLNRVSSWIPSGDLGVLKKPDS